MTTLFMNGRIHPPDVNKLLLLFSFRTCGLNLTTKISSFLCASAPSNSTFFLLADRNFVSRGWRASGSVSLQICSDGISNNETC